MGPNRMGPIRNGKPIYNRMLLIIKFEESTSRIASLLELKYTKIGIEFT